jgi:LAO/AO transport system kinase
LPTEPAALLELARSGDRVALARLLSYIERGGDAAMAVAALAYRADMPYTLGLTGAPGAGKSTLTDGLITAVRGGWPAVEGSGSVRSRAEAEGKAKAEAEAEAEAEAVPQVGVLAVDPTSPFSGGAILGDRVRMSQHALDPTVFIRSMATRGHLGGLSLAVPDAVRLLGAAGIGAVIVETVGVGGRHHGRGRDPGLGRLDASQQGRPPRGGRRLRHQQGGPAGRARGAA